MGPRRLVAVVELDAFADQWTSCRDLAEPAGRAAQPTANDIAHHSAIADLAVTTPARFHPRIIR